MFNFPTNTGDTITNIRNAIGREVTFYVPSGVDCPACDLDPVTNVSTNSFCPTCHGKGYITTYSGEDIQAHVTWRPAEILNWQTGGRFDTGDCMIQIEYTEHNRSLLNECAYVIVDEKKLTIRKQTVRGVPTPNRIIVDLLEEE